MSFQDIVGGEIKNNSNTLELTLKFASLPDRININLPPADAVNVEYQSVFSFYIPGEIKVGLLNYSDGTKKSVSWTDFSVNV
ncbi:MAG: hypothetical protein K8R21_05875, partial [Leptospira sp.]|nr:hypothetical protein [Leptospira sp.]